MDLTLAHVGAKLSGKEGYEQLTALYLRRCIPYARCQSQAFRSEVALLEWLDRQQRRTSAALVLLDSRGKEMDSKSFAAWLGGQRDAGAQHVVFAVGPADGWSPATQLKASLLLSLGRMTMAHALARLVIAEQIYRAFTILTGHPYHSGH
jgi:23S rRNA (pseudouridine1915-N3)-methyltransferase